MTKVAMRTRGFANSVNDIDSQERKSSKDNLNCNLNTEEAHHLKRIYWKNMWSV